MRFGTLCDDILVYSQAHHRDQRNITGRLARIRPDFEGRQADSIKPEDIDQWLTRNTKTPATSNRYRALFSLIFREALRNGKVTSNPARLVRQKHEENGGFDGSRMRKRKLYVPSLIRYTYPSWTLLLGRGCGCQSSLS